jgi:hypothetical protein
MLVIASSIFTVAAQERQPENKGAAQTSDAKSVGDQIEVKTDRFSGVTTVRLKPQVILDKPEHQLTMEIETKLGERKHYDSEKDEVRAFILLRSQSKEAVNFGDEELHVMVDGKPIEITRPIGDVDAGARTFLSTCRRPAIEQLSKAKKMEMRLGAIEIAIALPVIANLREYANQVLINQKTGGGKKP